MSRSSFLDVVQARYRSPATEERHSTLAGFLEREGEIVAAYWCASEPSAVALTRRLPQRRGRSKGSALRVHRVTAPGSSLASSRLLRRCDRLLVDAAGVFDGASRKVAFQWVFSVEAELLALVDREGRAPNVDEEQRLLAELDRIAAYSHRGAQARGRRAYRSGVLLGFAALAVILSAVVLVSRAEPLRVGWIETSLLFVSLLAGGLGAACGALVRLGATPVDYETRAAELRRSGARQPQAGAVVGVGIYVLAHAGALSAGTPRFWTCAVAAFVAAFGERRSRFVEAMLGFGARRRPASGARGWRLTADGASGRRFALLIGIIVAAVAVSTALLGADSQNRLLLAVLAGLLAGAVGAVAEATVVGAGPPVFLPAKPLVGATIGAAVFSIDRAYGDGRLSSPLPRLFFLSFVAALVVSRYAEVRVVPERLPESRRAV